jgi:hypothetical protein
MWSVRRSEEPDKQVRFLWAAPMINARRHSLVGQKRDPVTVENVGSNPTGVAIYRGFGRAKIFFPNVDGFALA